MISNVLCLQRIMGNQSDIPLRALHGSHLDPSEIADREYLNQHLSPKKNCVLFYSKIEDFLYVFRARRANLLHGVVKCTSAAGPNRDPQIALVENTLSIFNFSQPLNPNFQYFTYIYSKYSITDFLVLNICAQTI